MSATRSPSTGGTIIKSHAFGMSTAPAMVPVVEKPDVEAPKAAGLGGGLMNETSVTSPSPTLDGQAKRSPCCLLSTAAQAIETVDL